MHLSMISTMIGGVGGFPRGIGSEGYPLVGILTRMRCPRVGNTPYSKMAANKLIFCLHVNQPSSPHFHFKILLFLYMMTRPRGLINMQTKE